jgi:hypothetical protein
VCSESFLVGAQGLLPAPSGFVQGVLGPSTGARRFGTSQYIQGGSSLARLSAFLRRAHQGRRACLGMLSRNVSCWYDLSRTLYDATGSASVFRGFHACSSWCASLTVRCASVRTRAVLQIAKCVCCQKRVPYRARGNPSVPQ